MSETQVIISPSRRNSIVSIIAASFAASLLVTLAILVFMGIERDSAALSEQIVLTVFLESGANAKDIATTESDLKTVVGVDSVQFQSSASVKEAFVNRFATSISAVLPDNAFPGAMIVHLKEEYRTKDRIDSVVSAVLGMQSVGNVSYRTAFVEAVELRQKQEYAALWVIASVCALAVIVLLWQSVSRAGMTLQDSAGAVLGGVLIAMFIGIVVFANIKQVFPWLEREGWELLVKVQMLGSVIVCAFATFVLAINAVRHVARQDAQTESHHNSTTSIGENHE